jgi:glutathione S-transferase
MKITVYGVNHYDRGSKVRWLLQELGVPFENHWLNSDQGDFNEGSSYLKINPLGRIPAVTFDDRRMIESGAIVAYLADRFPEKGLAPAVTAKERLEYQQWMYYAVSIDSFATRIGIIEDIPAGEVLNQKTERFIGEVKDLVGFLGESLQGREYLTGQFSAADICVGYHLYISSLWPEMNDVIESNPNVSAYLKRLKTRKAAQDAKVFSYEA